MFNKTEILIIVLLIILCGLGWLHHSNQNNLINELRSAPIIRMTAADKEKIAVAREAKEMVDNISRRYRVNEEFAEQVVHLAYKYQRSDFPTAKDVIAIIGIESSFNPQAVSSLKRDPAVGLTQIRPGVWSTVIDRRELKNIDGQIRHGADILAHYYDIVGNKKGAVMSYNVGITAYKKGRTNQGYVDKFTKELQQYESYC